ncbi:SDR family NAD(P)-dependent oxidoreductase [Actinomadura sp. LOL_016]
MGSFQDRVAVVTGAAGGIGAGIVRALAAGGAHVVATDRVDGLADKVAREVGADGPRWAAVSADLAADDGADRVIGAAIERFGRLDILVNNAGGGIIRPFLDHTLETMRETVDRNLWTSVLCCRAALPHMRDAGYGRIVNVGADSVRNGLFEHAMYNAAKGGVHGLTTGLAREFAPFGITVNTVAPTGTDTPTVLSRPPDAVERYRKTVGLIPLGRFATVEEVASAVTYLASGAAGFITGQVVSVNGGTAML